MFSLDSVLDDLWPQARPAPWQKSLLKRLFYEDEFQQFAAAHRHLKGLDMVEQVLEHLDILCTVSARDLEQIPEHGPLVIIANHPTGTLDGLALLYAVSRVRRDVKVVTNRMLTHLEPLSSLFIPVDNMGGRTAKSSLVQMEQHLQNAGVLIFFPAGEVSRPTRKGIRDKKWHSGFIKLASKLRAPLLPVHIQAHNSLLFYASTLVSPTLSMLLLMQQMFRRRHSQLPIKIGQQIAWHHWHSATLSSREMAEQCRQHVIRLGKGVPGVFKTQCAIARPEDRATLKRELAQAECLGKTSDGKAIYLWQRNGQEDAPLLRELGRLREIAFRAVEEGSGKRRDTDCYDDDYLHLILWDEDDLEIVGAYRFMPTAMQMLNETYIAPSTCAMKTAVTRHHRCGGMSPKKDISPLPAMMALSANSTLLAMIRYNTHSGKSTPSRGMPSSWLRMTRLKAMRKTAVRISMVRSFICILPDGLRRIPTFSY